MNATFPGLSTRPGACRLGAIAFINTLPVYLGFQQAQPDLPLVYDSPAGLNRAVDAGMLDVSPVSSAFYLRNRERLVRLADLSVSSFGAVESVLLLSRVPFGPDMAALREIAVPDDSETSVALLAGLLQDETGRDMQAHFVPYPAGHVAEAFARTGAVLVIGDAALIRAKEGFSEGLYAYDLASLWAERTNLPVVFAVWVARKAWAEANPGLLASLNADLCASRDRFFAEPALQAEAVRLARSRCTMTAEAALGYFTRSLDYHLGPAHEAALQRFDTLLQGLSPQARTLAGSARFGSLA